MSKIQVTISGPSGAGKTSVAMALMEVLMDEFHIPVTFIDDDPQPVDIMSKYKLNLKAMAKKKTRVDIKTVATRGE